VPDRGEAVTAPADRHPVAVVVVQGDGPDEATRRELRALWRRATGERFSDDDADHPTEAYTSWLGRATGS